MVVKRVRRCTRERRNERKSRVVRHKRNSFSDTGLSIFSSFSSSSSSSSSSSPLVPTVPLSSRVPSGPETPCFFTGLWDFFHADRRVVHQRRLTEVFLSFGFLPISLLRRVYARSFLSSLLLGVRVSFSSRWFSLCFCLAIAVEGSRACCCTAMEKERGDDE